MFECTQYSCTVRTLYSSSTTGNHYYRQYQPVAIVQSPPSAPLLGGGSTSRLHADMHCHMHHVRSKMQLHSPAGLSLVTAGRGCAPPRAGGGARVPAAPRRRCLVARGPRSCGGQLGTCRIPGVVRYAGARRGVVVASSGSPLCNSTVSLRDGVLVDLVLVRWVLSLRRQGQDHRHAA
eukprot:COSAG02_NODE_3638_length_6442_cov_6.391297_6_plen_178_part_00